MEGNRRRRMSRLAGALPAAAAALTTGAHAEGVIDAIRDAVTTPAPAPATPAGHVPIQQQQRLQAASLGIAKGYIDLFRIRKKDDEGARVFLALLGAAIAKSQCTPISAVEANPDGSFSAKVHVQWRILGIGDTFRQEGLLTVNADRSWEYTHVSALDDKSEIFAAVLRVGEELTITSKDGCKVKTPAPPAPEPAPAPTKPGTDPAQAPAPTPSPAPANPGSAPATAPQPVAEPPAPAPGGDQSGAVK